ncbi:GGDEF domain-containing protein [Deinococcus arboris]
MDAPAFCLQARAAVTPRPAADAPPEPAAWQTTQRRMFAWLVGLASLACGAALWMQAPSFDPLDRVALPALGLGLLGLQGLLSLGVLQLPGAIRGAFIGAGAYLLLALNHQFSVLTPASRTLMENTYWFAVLYVAVFLVYPPRRATWLSGSLLLVSAAVCGLNLLLTVPAEARGDLTGASLQFLLVGAVLTILQATLGAQRTQLLASHAAAYSDALTGLGNRRAAEEHLAALTARGATYTLVLFDLDHFKRVNDLHGHAAGDLVLRGVGQAVQAHLPGGGVAARWGGEEFMLILPEQRDRQVRALLDTLRADLRGARYGTVDGVTACFGVATAQAGEDPEAVVARADAAMYRVKRQGRNDVHLADLRHTQFG